MMMMIPGNLLQAAISWKSHNFLLEYKKKPFVPDAVYGRQISKKTAHAAAPETAFEKQPILCVLYSL